MRAAVIATDAFLRVLSASWRVEFEGQAEVEAARRASPRGNVVFAFWHASLLVLAATHRRRDIQVLVSHHRDGELIARVLDRLGYGLVRGSSRRGGVEALFRMATLLDEGRDVAVTVDGPVGPRSCVHPGVVLVARRTGRPIVPVAVTFARGWELPTWDALRLPAAGTRVLVRYRPRLEVPLGCPAPEVETWRARLEIDLRDATLAADAAFARVSTLEDIQDRRSYWERASERDRPPAWLRGAAAVHGAARGLDRRLRPRPRGRGTRPWVLGVGNLEAGGTGKTPIVAQLARALADGGARVAVLTRGHGGRLGAQPAWAAGDRLVCASDETRLLVGLLGPGVRVLVAHRKRAGLALLTDTRECDVVVVDDAFQTVGLAVDRHLVLLDGQKPLGNGFLLPAGRLREPPNALRRADAVLFTRAAGRQPPVGTAWAHLGDRLFVAHESFGGLRTPAGAQVAPESLRGEGVCLISGIGRPQAFEGCARAAAAQGGFRVRRTVRVGDHAPLEPALRKLVGRLEALECSRVLTTAKDLARLAPGSKWDEPLLVVEQRLVIPDRVRLLEVLVPG